MPRREKVAHRGLAEAAHDDGRFALRRLRQAHDGKYLARHELQFLLHALGGKVVLVLHGSEQNNLQISFHVERLRPAMEFARLRNQHRLLRG
jgi:hypothetical protein